MYYVDETGAKVTSTWETLVPHNDEDAEEEKYWFKSSGKMAKNEKLVIDGKTYYFGNEGQMLTGWVDTTAYDEATSISGAVFCGEDGARLAKTWVKTTVPGADEDDTDEFWYYIVAKGGAQTKMAKSINGSTYLFGDDGKMLSGWVAFDGTSYAEIGGEGSEAEITTGSTVYFCGDKEDGHVKKNQWIKEWKPKEYYDEDADKDQYWYYIGKDGKVYVPAEEDATSANAYKFEDAEYGLTNKGEKTVAIKNIGDKYYVFNTNGEMQSGLLNFEAGMFYFGGSNDGARKTGSVTLEDGYGVEGKFLFNTTSTNKGVGITGPKSGKLYSDGLLIAADDYKYEVVLLEATGDKYIVNRSGSIQTTKKIYKDGDEVICDAENATFSTETANKGAVTF
jgi:glucan-binding YG repeat protein